MDVVRFIADQESLGLRTVTVAKRVQAMRRWYRGADLYDPTDSKLVAAALDNLVRDHAGDTDQQTQQARPVTPDEVKRLISLCLADGRGRGMTGLRDAALLAALYAGALRANEAVALDVGDVDNTHAAGIVLHVRRGKTDQHGTGRIVPIYRASTPAHCPVQLLSSLVDGRPADAPLFRRTSPYGWTVRRLSLSAVDYLVRRRIEEGRLLATSSHGFRHGAATQLSRAHGSLDAIASLLGHENLEQAREYINDANPFARVPDLLGL